MSTDVSLQANISAWWLRSQSAVQQQPGNQQLLQQSIQLSQQRLQHRALSIVTITEHTSLSTALWRSELLYSFASWLSWPKAVLQLLLSASYCSGLTNSLSNYKALSEDKALARLKAYPALFSAKLLQKAAPNVIQQLLAGCYGGERKIAYWQQQPCSVLLTLIDKLAPPTADGDFQSQLARRITLSRCEHELALLRTLLRWWQQNENTGPVSADSLLNGSGYLQLKHSDNKTVASVLSTSAALSAPVLDLATELNRQQQSIQSVALAVNLIGRDLLDMVLIDALINQQLSLMHHPQQRALQQLTTAFASSLYLLQPNSLSKAECRALTRCLLVPLWFDSTGYRLNVLRQQQDNGAALAIFSCYQKPAAATLAYKLLQQYQLVDWLQPLQRLLTQVQYPTTDCDNKTRLLLVAWFSCQAIFSATASGELQTLLHYYPAHNDVDQWLQTLAADAGSQCPLLLTM